MRPARRQTLIACALALALFGAGCSDDAVKPRPVDDGPPFVWQAQDVLPIIYDLNAVTIVGGDVVAVGDRGAALRFDGVQWSQYYTPTSRSLWGVWGSAAGNAIAVGDFGVIIREASPQWITMTSTVSQGLRGVWGTAPDDVFAVGLDATILYYDGNAWTRILSPTLQSLFSVWGRSHDDVYAVGLGGTILHFDGAGWTPEPSGTDEALTGVSGDPQGMVVVVGNRGTALRNDGDGWQPLVTDNGDVLQSVCVVAPDLAFAAGANGTVLRYDGIDWWRTQTRTSSWMLGIAGTGRTDVMAVGTATALHSDGTGWRGATRGAAPSLRAVWTSDSRSAVAVGLEGYVMHRIGDHWSRATLNTSLVMNAVWGISADNVYAAGQAGRLLHFDGTRWSALLDIGPDYYGIWGADENHIWVVGNLGRIVSNTGGGPWKNEASATTRRLNAIWGESAEHVFAVGAAGEVVELANNRWTRGLPKSSHDLYAVCGVLPQDGEGAASAVVYAVGAGGAIVHRDPRTEEWETMDSGVSTMLRAVAVGRGDVVFAAGDDGVLLKLQDGAWKAVPSPTTENIYGMCATPGGALFAAGGSGARDATMLYYGPEASE